MKLRALGSAGIAIPAALFGLVVVGVLGTGMWIMTEINARAGENRERGARALQIAEAGANHALAVVRDTLRDTTFTRLLRGSDNTANTADDGILVGLGLSSALAIPSTGRSFAGGTYYVQIFDDPADADGDPKRDSNRRVLARCTGVTVDGASASIDVVLGAPFSGVASNGNFTISGTAEVLGACGSVHANGNLGINGPITVAVGASASGTVTGDVEYPDGSAAPALSNQPEVEIPVYNPLDFCGPADFILQANGFIYEVTTGTSFDARSVGVFGWKRSGASPVVWEADGSPIAPGTVCAHGNVKISSNPGSAASPLPLSIIATKSIEISGNPYLQPAHPDEIQLMAGGDVSISGNPSASNENYEGLIYAYSQCKVSGNPRLLATMLCADNPNPLGAIEYASENTISGNPEITSTCSGFNKKRPLSWYQTLGA